MSIVLTTLTPIRLGEGGASSEYKNNELTENPDVGATTIVLVVSFPLALQMNSLTLRDPCMELAGGLRDI